jgi:glutathione S-transferase
MKLYFSKGACSLSPHIVLRELGAKFDLEAVDLATKKTGTGKDFTSVNPKGYVPALELDNGEVLTEGSAIVQYLADTMRSGALFPKPGTMERYRALEMLNFVAAEIHKGMGGLFDKSLTDAVRRSAIEKIGKRVDYLESVLSKRNYLLGDEFSVVDAYAFTCLGWGQWVGVDLAKWPHVSAYMKRIAERPSVQSALAAEAA